MTVRTTLLGRPSDPVAAGLRARSPTALGPCCWARRSSSAGFSSGEVGLVLAAVVAGTVVSSLAIGRWGDRWGRRRSYVVLYLALAVTGVVFAFSDQVWVLCAVALTGALVHRGRRIGRVHLTRAVNAGDRAHRPGTTHAASAPTTRWRPPRALSARWPPAARTCFAACGRERRSINDSSCVFVPVALGRRGSCGHPLVAGGSRTATATRAGTGGAGAISSGCAAAVRRCSRSTASAAASSCSPSSSTGSRSSSTRRSACWGWCSSRLVCSQTVSFLAAPRLAERFGLLRTMVFTHLPSNVLLAAIAFAPNLPAAIALLFGPVRAVADGRAHAAGLRHGDGRSRRSARQRPR